VRRAALLAGRLGQPETAAAELDALRAPGHRLSPADDIHVGLALADLYEHALGDPGRAMAELRRLLDLYPNSAHLRRIRRELAELKRARFPAP
jgi:tetratricopeptide (TPR) repeat protein